MENQEMSEILKDAFEMDTFTLIWPSNSGAKVLHCGKAQDLLSVLRSAIKTDYLLLCGCADVADECFRNAMPEGKEGGL